MGKCRGSAAVLAMIFIVVFGAMAAAFYSMITTAICVARNDRDAAMARAAAESGMEMLKFILSSEQIEGSASYLDMDGTVAALGTQLDESFGTTLCAVQGGVGIAPEEITFPQSNRLALGAGSGEFSAVIALDATATDAKPVLAVTVTGWSPSGSIHRVLSARYVPEDTDLVTISPYDVGVYTNGAFEAKNNVLVKEQGKDFSDKLMLAIAAGTAFDIKNADIDDIQGQIWIKEGATANVSETIPVGTLPVAPMFTLPDASVYASDSSFEYCNTWNDFLAKYQTSSKKRFYVAHGNLGKGGTYSSIVSIGGIDIPGSLVFGPEISLVQIDGKKQGPTTIDGDSSFYYSIYAPSAQITYNGNTAANISGYIVANKFEGNGTNAAGMTVTNGGLITLSTASDACVLNQLDFTYTLPPPEQRPATGGAAIRRNFQMDYASYAETSAF